MMKKILNIIAVFVLLSSLLSCDDFLGNKPKGYTIPEYYEDYALLLNDMNLNFLGINYPAYITDDVTLADDNVPSSVDYSSKSEEERACYNFQNGDIFAQGSNDGFYADAYKQIYTYNVVINNIMKVPDGTEANKKMVKAEALVHRAFAYLQLVNIYAKHYDKNSASKDLGVPIVLSEDVNSKYERNSVKDIYDLIIKDLTTAANDLAQSTQNPFHPNKSTAYGLLARTYLYMGEFELALTNAKEAIKYNKSGKLIDYTKYSVSSEDYWSRITDADGTPFPQRGDNAANMYVKLPPNDLSSCVFASDDLMQTFKRNLPTGAIDKREELFYAKDAVNTFEQMSFPGYTMYVAHIMPNLGLTLQEIYLMLAECEARVSNGSKDQSLAYLNILRNNRIVNNIPLTASTKEEALRIALDERRREMAFWAQMRFVDLKRLNKESKFAKEVVHKLENQTFKLPANDPRYIMPLPYSVREFNPNIPQYTR